MEPKRYLVTGGTGFIGSGVVKRLLQKGHFVRILDNNFRGSTARLRDVHHKVEFVEGDIRDPFTVEKCCQNIDGIFHLAYINGTEYFYTKPDLVLEVGVKGMIHILDGATKHGVKELILFSSSEVYHEPEEIPTSEKVSLVIPDPLNPRYSYSSGKIISEMMALHWGRKILEKVWIVRPHNVYGPNMGYKHVIPEFIRRFYEILSVPSSSHGAIPFPIQGSGEETRAFVFIEDFLDGLEIVLERGKPFEIYHIGTEEEIAIKDFALKIAEILGLEIQVQAGEKREGGPSRRCPSIAKIQSLGYKPQYSLREGLQKTLEWYLQDLKEKETCS